MGTLILAAGGRDEQIVEAIDEIGLAATAEVVHAEILLRLTPPQLDRLVRVQLELRHGTERSDAILVFDGESVTAEPGRIEDEAQQPTVRYDLYDVVRSLFGPGESNTPSRNVVLSMPKMHSWAEGADWALMQARSTSAVIAAIADRPTDLGALSLANGSDKWGGCTTTPRTTSVISPLSPTPPCACWRSASAATRSRTSAAAGCGCGGVTSAEA
ncbi:hypothetical protein [Actinoalloteichus hymeniacidonis]|uniref:hypothetical protein n=1 Tax=Actinoalloteichus hymeniacidonis TaxID=340345 RepID=UPI000A0094E5|nr:hypothetical protein [Actinoalloteichus hymeniacidonis]MBB5907857.1 hypothetical protein [Actinoalloteichus hymeniacidonis]